MYLSSATGASRAYVAVGSVSVVIFLIVVMRVTLLAPVPLEGSAEYYQRRGAEAFATLPMAMLEDSDALGDVLESVQVVGLAKISDNQKNALLAHVETFLVKRFIDADSDRYIEWRLSEGCQWYSSEELVSSGLPIAHELYFNEPLSEKIGPVDLFGAYFIAGTNFGKGANQPVKIASGNGGVLIAVGHVTEANPGGPDLDGSGIPVDLWYGGFSRSARSWFRPAVTNKQLVARYGRVMAAEVGIIFEFENGTRRPVILRYSWDPQRRDWVLQQINLNNYQSKRLSGFEY